MTPMITEGPPFDRMHATQATLRAIAAAPQQADHRLQYESRTIEKHSSGPSHAKG